MATYNVFGHYHIMYKGHYTHNVETITRTGTRTRTRT